MPSVIPSQLDVLPSDRAAVHRLNSNKGTKSDMETARQGETWTASVGVLPTVVSSGAIWTEIEPSFHIELEAAVRINVLPDQRYKSA